MSPNISKTPRSTPRSRPKTVKKQITYLEQQQPSSNTENRHSSPRDGDCSGIVIHRSIDDAREPILMAAPQQKSIERDTSFINYPLDGVTRHNEKNDLITPYTKRKIHIFGGSQCRNLASVLISSRQASKFNNNKYEVLSIIKPNASTQEILKSCNNITDSCHDYMIVCLGECDSDPTKLSIDLITALKQFKKLNVIILSVLKNRCLNEKSVNGMIKNYCKYLPNCTHLDNIKLKYFNPHMYKNPKYLTQICDKINFFIDCNDYETQYLCKIKNTAVSLDYRHKKCSTKIDTTPYCLHRNQVVSDKSSPHKQSTLQTSLDTPFKKGTIPYYFSKIATNSNPVSNNNKTNHTEPFFREE